MEKKLLDKFEKDFKEYVEASIRYCETIDWEKSLSFEGEVKWIKNWLRKNV